MWFWWRIQQILKRFIELLFIGFRHVKKPSATESKLFPAKIPDEVYTAMGKIIRAFAEIEDLILLYLCRLAETPESVITLLLGRTPVSAKLKLAQYLARSRGKETLALHKEIFTKEFSDALKKRNAIAHGTLLGVDENGAYAFKTAKELPTDKPNLSVECFCLIQRP